MDTLGFATPAMVRTLLVPVSSIHRSDFLRHRRHFETIKDVRAVDLTSNPGMFNPMAYPQGRIFHNFVTRDEDSDSFFLHDFEPYRKTSIVIGICQYTDDTNDDSIRALKLDLSKKYSSAIYTAIIIFNCPEGVSTKVADSYIVNNVQSNMETILCDITSRFLTNFSRYASAYEHTTLRSPGNLTGNLLPKSASRTSLLDKQKKPFDTSDKTKGNIDKGRKLKLSANFFLMVGNYKKSFVDFCDAISLLSSTNDHIWLASAFDGLAVCLFLLSFVGSPLQLPNFLRKLIENTRNIDFVKLRPSISSPRPSFQKNAQSTSRRSSSVPSDTFAEVSLETVTDYILNLSKLSLFHYQIALKEGSEYIPQIVITESGIRNAFILVLIGTEGLLSENIIESSIYNTSNAWINKKVLNNSVDYAHFNLLVSQSYKLEFKTLSTYAKLNCYSVLIKLYSMLDMPRKSCLMINGFMSTINLSTTYSIVNDFNFKELDFILESYITNYGIRLSNDYQMYKPNVLQLKAIYQVVEFCSKIGFHQGFVKYGSLMISDFRTLLSENDQISLFEEVKTVMNENGISTTYWDERLLIDIEFDHEENQLIEDEYSDIFITFNNPFAFPIEIRDYSLSSLDDFKLELSINTNFDFVTPFKSIIIQPKELKRIPFILVAKSYSMLKIDGFNASICGCKPQKFTIDTSKENTNFKVKGKSIKADLETRLKQKSADDLKITSIKVVHKQPRLQLINIELDDYVMLLEGEYRQFTVTLKNTSDVPINQLDLKFHDSTTGPLNNLLNKKDVPANEVYELEYYLYVKKPFEILNKVAITKIEPFETFDLDVRLWGKRGVTEAKLILDYANQKADLINFKRELLVPVKISVCPSVELAGCDIIPLSSNTNISMISNNHCVNYLKSMAQRGYEASDFCILALDFMNMCPEAVEIKLQTLFESSIDPAFQEGSGAIEGITDDDYELTTVLNIRQNIRVFLPLKRVDLNESYLEQNIPSLRKKQYIKDYKTPEAEQQYIKRSFWYRNEILKRLRATWRISDTAQSSVSAGRTGTIDIRSLKLSSKMLNMIELDKMVVSLELKDENNLTVSDLSSVKIASFYSVKITLLNRYKDPVFGMLRHIVVCKNPPYTMDNKVLFNGTLEFGIGDQLCSGEERSFHLSIVFLERGDYEWGALFDQLDDHLNIKKQHLQRQQLKLTVL